MKGCPNPSVLAPAALRAADFPQAVLALRAARGRGKWVRVGGERRAFELPGRSRDDACDEPVSEGEEPLRRRQGLLSGSEQLGGVVPAAARSDQGDERGERETNEALGSSPSVVPTVELRAP
jgi:hypothetical protein